MSAQLSERQISARDWFDQMLSQNNRLLLMDNNLPWLNETRQQARALLQELSLPNRKQERWRYTDVSKLYANTFYSQTAPVTGIDGDDIDSWVYPETDSYRLVFVNGQFVASLSRLAQLPGSFKIGSLRAAMSTDANLVSRAMTQQRERPEDVFSALNRALLNDGLFIHVSAGVVVDRPVEVLYLNTNFEQSTLAQPHSLVNLERGAGLKLVERYASCGDADYFLNASSAIFLGEQAALQHYCLQQESPKAYHLNRIQVRQQHASEYRAMHLATGAAWTRTEISVEFSGAQANTDVQGVYATGPQQYTDYHLDVHHAQPGCRSREDFRGIVYGQGRAVFDGRIVVDRHAQRSDAMLSNKNLLLSDDAEVDTKPQLEIYADDVKCGHGTTVGRLDPQQIFYLRSRGIPEAQARRLLCLGFAEQILASVDDDRMHDFMLAQFTGSLHQVEAPHE